MKHTKSRFLKSVIALLACFAMLVGSTFAWFTDSVSSMNNIITSGNLDLEMYWTDDLNSGNWYNVEDPNYNTIFGYDNWEPGYTQVRYLKLVNAGSLALNYKLAITPQGEVGKLAEVITVHYANGKVPMNDRSDLSNLNSIGLLDYVMSGTVSPEGTLLPEGEINGFHDSGETVITLAMSMLTTAGNDYQSETVGDGFSVTAIATQATYEEDSFDELYDEDAEYPVIMLPAKVTAPVAPVDGKIPAGGMTMSGGGISATLPEGVKLEDGVTELAFTVTPKDKTAANITPVNNEKLIPMDVHIEGVAADNTVPIVLDLGARLPKYLNIGNYILYHVENGVSNPMTLVDSVADLNAHNQFTYDAATGNVVVCMATFSDVTAHVNTDAPWTGKADIAWYTENPGATEFTIVNADELFGLSQLVGGMADVNEDGVKDDADKITFAGKTIKLIADIDFDDVVDENNKVFYPIGYYNNMGTYEKTNASGVVSNLSSFEGTFDGNGHTIANFYQNTWEMFGDYNNGYAANSNHYKDGMGLFGYVYGGTVKNLTVENFSCDGEFTPGGTIAAFACNATFENIAVIGCNPRVYNTGNGGIVGIGGNDNDPETYALNFKNITVDNTNTITALWGSWDVACGGLVGMFRGAGHAYMDNCHVSAKIDVFNDVCGNYQYYRYRYAGMLIGTNKNMITVGGKIVPETDKYHATDCTVHFDDWNDYYYCEMVVNSIASYTHDHQFSRLTEVAAVNNTVAPYTYTTYSGDTVEIPTSGRYNFVVIGEGERSSENATCYHFVNGAVYNHEEAGYEDVDVNGDGVKETVLKEDRQHYYLPFNQLFTGYGWGVEHVPIYNDGSANVFEGVTILDTEYKGCTEKFNYIADTEIVTGSTLTVGKLFEKLDNVAELDDDNVQITVSRVNGRLGDAEGIYSANIADWKNGTVTFKGKGQVYITISDYYFCKPTTVKVTIITDNDGELEWDW